MLMSLLLVAKVTLCVSASGYALPPMVIFSCKNCGCALIRDVCHFYYTAHECVRMLEEKEKKKKEVAELKEK